MGRGYPRVLIWQTSKTGLYIVHNFAPKFSRNSFKLNKNYEQFFKKLLILSFPGHYEQISWISGVFSEKWTISLMNSIFHSGSFPAKCEEYTLLLQDETSYLPWLVTNTKGLSLVSLQHCGWWILFFLKIRLNTWSLWYLFDCKKVNDTSVLFRILTINCPFFLLVPKTQSRISK